MIRHATNMCLDMINKTGSESGLDSGNQDSGNCVDSNCKTSETCQETGRFKNVASRDSGVKLKSHSGRCPVQEAARFACVGPLRTRREARSLLHRRDFMPQQLETLYLQCVYVLRAWNGTFMPFRPLRARPSVDGYALGTSTDPRG